MILFARSLCLSISCRTCLVRLLLAVIAIGSLASMSESPAKAEGPRPFYGNVAATWDNIFNGLFAPPATFTGTSQVTHMGHTLQQGTLVLGAPDENFVAPGSGFVTMTAANGDELTFYYEGLLYAATGEGIGTFTFTSGTGRFANATGGGTFYALIDTSLPENQPMTVVLDGQIDY